MQRAENTRRQADDFKRPKIQITSLATVPGTMNRAIVSSGERKLWDTIDHYNGCDTRYNVSQVQILANGKAVFAGVGENGHPGAVQIWKFPLEQLSEI